MNQHLEMEMFMKTHIMIVRLISITENKDNLPNIMKISGTNTPNLSMILSRMNILNLHKKKLLNKLKL